MIDNMELKGKIAVITGATGGIGKAIVAELDREEGICVLIGTQLDQLKNLQKNLKTSGGKSYVADFTDVEDVIKVGREIAGDFESIDILLNVAGIGVYKPIEGVSVKDWQDSFAIGNTAPFFLSQTLLPKLSKSDVGTVINIGSGMGVLPAGGRSVYSSMKFALRGQTLSLAEEFKRTKPHFVLMTLGSVLTSFGPMSFQEKKKEMEGGKGYLTAESVAKKIIEIVKNEDRDVEYTMYPGDYIREWQKS